MFGPITGGLTGGLSDIVGCVLIGYAINPIITLGALLISLICGFVYSKTSSVFWSVLLAHVVGSMIIKSLGLYILYGYFLLSAPLFMVYNTTMALDLDLDLISLNDWLSEFINFERSPDKNMLNLDTMEKLCSYFDHPETSSPCFHVAGSKGKGTIAASIAGILNAAGYKVGIYASPHAYHFTERVCSSTGPFPAHIYYTAEAELKTGVDHLIQLGELKRELLTWFELVTMFAMLVFREAGVDYTVYEVGMGGRLDTTNIISPECISMGLIELEHTEYLGNTLTEIATEKAGVFKPGVPIISVPQVEEVSRVFNKAAKANSASITYVPDGDYQVVDAKVAELSVKTVLPKISDEIVAAGLKQVALPARYEIIRGVNNYSLPFILIDGAHTASSVEAVIKRLKKDGIRGNLLFGCASDKNAQKMAALILESKIFNKIYLTKPGGFKESNLESISKAFSSCERVQMTDPDYARTIRVALHDSSSDKLPLIVLGSFHLAGEVKKII